MPLRFAECQRIGVLENQSHGEHDVENQSHGEHDIGNQSQG